MSLMSLLSQFGPSALSMLNQYAGGQAVNSANRQTRGNVARANLQNAFGGNAVAQQVQPELGKWGRLGVAAQAGVDTFQTAQQMAQAKKLRDLQMQQAQQQLEAGADQRINVNLQMQGERQDQAAKTMAAQKQFGADIASQGGFVPVTVESPYNTRRPPVRTETMRLE